MRIARIALCLVLALFIFTACKTGGGGDSGTSPAEDERDIPEVIESVTPADGVDDAPVTTKVMVKFTRPIESNEASEFNVTKKATGGKVDGKIYSVENGTKLVFKPKNELEPGKRYNCELRDIFSSDGEKILEEYEWSFRTRSGGQYASLPESYRVYDIHRDSQGLWMNGFETGKEKNPMDFFILQYNTAASEVQWKSLKNAAPMDWPGEMARLDKFIVTIRLSDTFEDDLPPKDIIEGRFASDGSVTGKDELEHKGFVPRLAPNTDTGWLYAGSGIRHITVYDSQGSQNDVIELPPQEKLHDLDYMDGGLFVCGTRFTSNGNDNDRDLFVAKYDTETLTRVGSHSPDIQGLQGEPRISAKSGDIYVSTTNVRNEKIAPSTVLLYQGETPEWRREFEGYVRDILATDDGVFLAMAGKDVSSPVKLHSDGSTAWAAKGMNAINDPMQLDLHDDVLFLSYGSNGLARFNANTGTRK